MADELKMNMAAYGALTKGDLENFFVAMTPGGILKQEADGQKDLNARDILPKRILNGELTQEQLESIGFRFSDEVDDIFVQGTLPPGWTKVPTEHSMHTDILDENGVVRGSIFYKAAFYDRDAHMHLLSRFCVHSRYVDESFTSDVTITVQDRKTSTTLFTAGTTPRTDNVRYSELVDAANAWLKEAYPRHRDPMAYWE